jgi:radical SAM/Cys-rich protein
MSRTTMEAVLRALSDTGASTLDITGGAPEMHPEFRWFVDQGIARGARVMVRTNLTILLEAGYQDLPEWFAARRVHLVASLPCYTVDNVDRQRGRGTYEGSIDAIRILNAAGYGRDPELPLDLVYNPLGPSVPGPQAALEADYRRELAERWGLVFSRLLTITNMPIGRFAVDLERAGRAGAYDALLRERFNPDTVDGLMCRHQLHVAWDGRLSDCDFNYAIGLGVEPGACLTIETFDARQFLTRRIATGPHCFGCTAGSGSSCGGALA